MQYYVLDNAGRIINAVQAPTKAKAQETFPYHSIKTEEEIPLAVLNRYQFWNDRP